MLGGHRKPLHNILASGRSSAALRPRISSKDPAMGTNGGDKDRRGWSNGRAGADAMVVMVAAVRKMVGRAA